MKKSFEINLGGRIFNIDEDAYELLKTYMEELRKCFSGKEEGAEIIADIELRLGELCEARMREGSARIIDYAMVVEFTGRIGCPESIAENAAGDTTGGNEASGTASSAGEAREPWRDAMLLGKKLYRDMRNRVIGGVFSGIAAYCGINVWLLRVSAILLTLFVFGIFMPIIYVIVWLVLPYAKSVTDRMRMRDIKPLPGESAEDAWRREYERSTAEMLHGGEVSDNKGCLSGCIVSLALFILLPVIMMIVFITGVVRPFFFGVLPDSLFSAAHSMLVGLLAVPIAGILLFCLVYYILGRRGKVAPLGGRTRTLLVVVLIVLASVLVYVAVDRTSPVGASLQYSSMSNSQTTAEELQRFIDRAGEMMPPEKISLLKNYFALADNYTYSKKCTRILWHHIPSVAGDSVVPFVSECTELDDKVIWQLMPRDEWSGCMAPSSSVSQISIVSRSVGDAGLYCLIDTAAKHIRVDRSRSQNFGNVKVEMNSIPGWQVDVVDEIAAEDRSEGCFALGLKSYRGVKIIKGTMPKLTIYETIDGEEQNRDILHTLYRSREMHD